MKVVSEMTKLGIFFTIVVNNSDGLWENNFSKYHVLNLELITSQALVIGQFLFFVL